LIADVGPNPGGDGLNCWAAWANDVPGRNADQDPITDSPLPFIRTADGYTTQIDLPATATSLAILNPAAKLALSVNDRVPG